MHSDPEDRLYPQERRRGPALHIILIIIAVAIIIGAIYLPGRLHEPTVVEESIPAAPTAAPPEPQPAIVIPPAPDIPRAPEPEPAAQPEQQVVIAPATLATSDEELRQMLGSTGDPAVITPVLQAGDLVLRGAALIDGLSQGLILRKILPLKGPAQKFSPRITEDTPYLDHAIYQRFDSYAGSIEAIDPALLLVAFHRFRPLLEAAYEELGYDAEDMDNALIRSLDYILATPEPAEPVALKRKEAVFQYADPELENLLPVQKQLLRMGPENSAIIKRWVRELRQRLLGESVAP